MQKYNSEVRILIRDISEILDAELLIKNTEFAQNYNVVPPVPTFCRAGDKPYSRLFYIKQGAMEFYTLDKKEKILAAEEGSVLYLPCDFEYYSEWKNGERGAYETVLFTLWENDEHIELSNAVTLLVSPEENRFEENFSDLKKVWLAGAPGYRLEFKARVYLLLKAIALSKMKKEVKAKFKSIYKGIMHIENNYLEDTCIEELAQMCHVSMSTFRRLFVEYKGETPIKYRNILRLKRAEELLKSGEYTVSEAAEASAIPDVAYFSKLFKKVIGISPSEIKK